MPRIILSPPPKSPDHDKLVKRLAQELMSPAGESQPFIIERQIEGTGTRHVHVIWDRWKTIRDEQRSDIIWDAYTEAEGKESDDIALASGVTPAEALVFGLLPFKVVPVRRRHEPKPPAQKHEKARQGEARGTLLGADAEELRYPSLELAIEAKSRLEKALPGSEWAVVEDMPVEQ